MPDSKLYNVYETKPSFFQGVKKFGTHIWTSMRKSNKLKFLILFTLILIVVNYVLLLSGHMSCSAGNPEGKYVESLVDSMYLSTTQITTMGYGDITPKTLFAKSITFIVHIFVMFLALGLAAEFGADNALQKMMDESVESANKRLLERESALRTDILNVVTRYPEGRASLSYIMDNQAKATNIEERIKDKMHEKLLDARHSLELRSSKEEHQKNNTEEQHLD